LSKADNATEPIGQNVKYPLFLIQLFGVVNFKSLDKEASEVRINAAKIFDRK